MHCASRAAAGSSREASGLPTSTFLKVGALMSSAGTGVAGREEERLCLWKAAMFSLLEEADAEASILSRGVVDGVVGRDIGGVGGMSPVMAASAWTERQSIFIAVSGRRSFASQSWLEAGGEGIVEGSIGPELSRGIRPASSEGLGGSGGEVTDSSSSVAAMADGRLRVGDAAARCGDKEGGGDVKMEDKFWVYNNVGKQSGGYCCCTTLGAMKRGGRRLDAGSA